MFDSPTAQTISCAGDAPAVSTFVTTLLAFVRTSGTSTDAVTPAIASSREPATSGTRNAPPARMATGGSGSGSGSSGVGFQSARMLSTAPANCSQSAWLDVVPWPNLPERPVNRSSTPSPAVLAFQ